MVESGKAIWWTGSRRLRVEGRRSDLVPYGLHPRDPDPRVRPTGGRATRTRAVGVRSFARIMSSSPGTSAGNGALAEVDDDEPVGGIALGQHATEVIVRGARGEAEAGSDDWDTLGVGGDGAAGREQKHRDGRSARCVPASEAAALTTPGSGRVSSAAKPVVATTGQAGGRVAGDLVSRFCALSICSASKKPRQLADAVGCASCGALRPRSAGCARGRLELLPTSSSVRL